MSDVGHALAPVRCRAREALAGLGPEAPAFMDPAALAGRLRTLPNAHGYTVLEPELRRRWLAWERTAGRERAGRFNAGVLLRLIADFDPSAQRHRLPGSVAALYPAWLEGIVQAVEDRKPPCPSLDEDAFLKDLGLACGLLLPIGARLVEIDSGWSRRVALAGGAAQLLRYLRFQGLSASGPCYQMHVYLRRLEAFDPPGWRRSLERMAALLRLNPRMTAVFGCAWLYDPALAEVSPHLAYCRELALESGATDFLVGPDSRSGALARSPTRRRLHAEGRYQPRTYLVVWPRQRLIAWAERRMGGAVA